MNDRNLDDIIPKELGEVRKIFTNITSYVSSLIDIGYGTGTDRAITTVLLLASVFLTIASGYTTFSGLHKYAPFIIAFLLTLGIQGLLFGVSWRLGKLYIAGDMSPAMWSVWLVTIFVSVFFSYASLLDTVYPEKERESNRGNSSITIGGNILKNLDDDFKKKLTDKKLTIDKSLYLKWKDDMISMLTRSQEFAKAELNKRINTHQELENKYNHELKNGGTQYINSSGKPAISNPGDGENARKYKKEADDYGKYELDMYRKKSDQALELGKTIIRDIGEFEESKNTEKLKSAHSACIDLVLNIGGDFRCNSDALGDEFNELTELYKSYNEFLKSCSNDILKDSFDDNIKNIRGCVISYGSVENADNYLNKLDDLQRKEGVHAHFFIIVINELLRFNYLAIGSLILAIVVDVLILLCSLVAARHSTFLNVTSRKDLLQMESYPLDIVMDVDTEITENDNTFIRRIKFILNNATFDIKYAKDGFSMIIPMEKIIEMGMHKELGTFLTMDLAQPDKKFEIIKFRTSFILWMCEQVVKKDQSNTSNSELRKAFIGED